MEPELVEDIEIAVDLENVRRDEQGLGDVEETHGHVLNRLSALPREESPGWPPASGPCSGCSTRTSGASGGRTRRRRPLEGRVSREEGLPTVDGPVAQVVHEILGEEAEHPGVGTVRGEVYL